MENINIEQLLQQRTNIINKIINSEQILQQDINDLAGLSNKINNSYESQLRLITDHIKKLEENNKTINEEIEEFQKKERELKEKIDLEKNMSEKYIWKHWNLAFEDLIKECEDLRNGILKPRDNKKFNIEKCKEDLRKYSEELEKMENVVTQLKQNQTQSPPEETKTVTRQKESDPKEEYRKMGIEQLLQEKAKKIEKITNEPQIAEVALKDLSDLNDVIVEKYRNEIEKMYVSVDKDTLRRVETVHEKAAELGIKGDFIRNRNIPNSQGSPYDVGLIEAPKFADGPKEKKFIEYDKLKKYQQLVNRYHEERKINADFISPYISKIFYIQNTTTLMHDNAVLKSGLSKDKDRLERMGISIAREQPESIITEEEKQKNIEEYIYARNTLETLYKEANLYNGDQKTFNETRKQLIIEIEEIETKLKEKRLLEEAKDAYNKDFQARRNKIIEQYKNKQSTPKRLNLEEKIKELHSEIAEDEKTMKSHITNGYLQEIINVVSKQILAEVKIFKHYSESNPGNEKLKDKYVKIKSANKIATKIQEMINQKQPITDIFKNIVALYNAMKVIKHEENLNDEYNAMDVEKQEEFLKKKYYTLNIISTLSKLGEKYEKEVEELKGLTDLKNRQESSEVNKTKNEVSNVPSEGGVVQQTPETKSESENLTARPAQELTQRPTLTPEPIKECKVEKRSVWQWVKDNKKQILIIAGLVATAIAVGKVTSLSRAAGLLGLGGLGSMGTGILLQNRSAAYKVYNKTIKEYKEGAKIGGLSGKHLNDLETKIKNDDRLSKEETQKLLRKCSRIADKIDKKPQEEPEEIKAEEVNYYEKQTQGKRGRK